MPQLHLPRKLVATIQAWVSVVLIVLSFVFSLLPIITIETPGIANEIGSMINELGLPMDEDMQQMLESDDIEVTPLKLVGSIGLIVKIVGAASDESSESAKELESYLETPEGKESVITAVSIAFSLINLVEPGALEGANIISIVFNVLISIFGFLGTLALTLIIPIMLLIKAITAVLCIPKAITDPESVASTLGSKLPGVISLPLVFMLFQCVVPGMTYGFGIVMVCALAIASVFVNVLASRAREYPNEEFKYLNILQGGALVGIVGFMVFFFNIINTGIFKAFTGGHFAGYIANVTAILAINEEAVVQQGFIVDAVLMLVYLALILGCTSYLDKAARRLSCTVRRERPKGIIGMFTSGKIKDNNVVSAVLLLATYIIPTYVSGSKNYYIDPTSTEAVGDGSFLEAADFSGSALTGALIGIIIMIIAEIAVIVLKKKFVKLSVHEQETLMIGQAQTSAEKLAEAERTVAEAHAQVASAAEAPAEDNSEA